MSLAHYMLGGPAAYSNSWAAACWSWVVSAAYWFVIGLPTFYVVGRCLDFIPASHVVGIILAGAAWVLSTILACRYVPRCAATCGALALAYDYCVHEIFVDGELVEDSFATDLRRWVLLRRKRGSKRVTPGRTGLA